MTMESALKPSTVRKQRRDVSQLAPTFPKSGSWLSGALFLLMATVFVVVGGSAQEPSDAEARLGLAATAGLGPYAQVMGGWDPSISPGRVVLSQIWHAVLGGPTGLGAVRWPDAIAAILMAFLVRKRCAERMSSLAGTFAALAMLACFATIDRSTNSGLGWLAGLTGLDWVAKVAGLDWVAGLAVVAAMDRLLSKGSDWVAGAYLSLCVIFGGWPCVAAVLLPVILLGRASASLSVKLLLAPVLTFAAMSAWALSAERVELWASWLTLPLTQAPAWKLGVSVLAVGLPFSPISLLGLLPTVRQRMSDTSRAWLGPWTQVAIISLLAGTLIPGLAQPCGMLMLVTLAMIAASVMDRAWVGDLASGSRRGFLAMVLMVGGLGGLVLVGAGGFLGSAQPYYRGVGFVLFILGAIAGLLSVDAVWTGTTKQALRAMIVLAVGFKVAHASYYVPETSYRFGQGPWGRAIGQHVPPRFPIYVFHAWDPALVMATEHPVRRLPQEVQLKAQPGSVQFVLLLEEEFNHWPEVAPKIIKVRDFEDERGRIRVLARTPGRLVRHVVEK